MSGAAFLRVKKLTGTGIVLSAAKHNKRAIQQELGASGSIDPRRTAMNFSLMGEQSPEEVSARASVLMESAGILAMRKDGIRALEIVCSLPATSTIDCGQYFSACLSWAEQHFGCPVLSADVHLDEAAPHCHILIIPLVEGRMKGARLLGGKAQLQAMHGSFHNNVAARFGLKKTPRMMGQTRESASSLVIAELRKTNDACLGSKLWPEFRELIEKSPETFVQALGLKVDAPKKRRKTVVEIFTSKGKGHSDREVEKRTGNHASLDGSHEKSIDFDGQISTKSIDFEPNESAKSIDFEGQKSGEVYIPNDRSICSVDFDISAPLIQPPKPSAAMAKKALKALLKLPVGVDDKRLVLSAIAGGVSLDDLAGWLGDMGKVEAIVASGDSEDYAYLFDWYPEDHGVAA